jgi:hypothetical protein
MDNVVKNGSYVMGKPFLLDLGAARRDVRRASAGDLEGRISLVHAASMDDVTPPFAGEYDADCSCCWLGFSHSRERHERSVAERRAARKG